MRKTIATYKALSDPNRVRILLMLQHKPLCVCEIVDILGLANSTVSKHLSILRNVDLIMDEKTGRWVNYRISRQEESRDVQGLLNHLNHNLGEDVQIISDREKLNSVDRYVICGSNGSSS